MISMKGGCFKKSMPLFTLGLLLCAVTAQAMPMIPITVPREAKCPVCGMFVARFPDWSASIAYQDGTKVYFDGAKDLFRYYLNPKKYDPARKRADISFLGVRDYYSLELIDGRKTYFVIGSNVHGPMGKELIPFSKKGDADGFRMDHQGKKLIRFEEITPALLKTLQ